MPRKTRSAALVEAKNQGESLIHSSEQSLKDYGDKVSEEDRTAIADAIAALKTAVEAEEPDADDIQAKSQTLMEVSMKLGQAMYEQSQAEGAVSAGTSGHGIREMTIESLLHGQG
jgi:molecular chaperone DnaK